tara:strand:+ start:475 stop:678 length:204 start_codon:yes stop_codon:yes gene_type:complete
MAPKKHLLSTLFKMNSINFNSRTYEQKNSKDKEISTLDKGITKTLIEKYKPKVSCKIENLNKKLKGE